MSFLSPLFLLGAAAILGPIVFHLIRRVTREKVPFSSLMFLQPTPPRLTRKSRLEHILLLLLRCLALILLAMAFARPYFANDQQMELDADEQVHHCLLVDMSASMRREGAWEQVLTTSEKWLTQWKDQSIVHVFFFDESLVDGIRADQWAPLSPENRIATSLNLIRSQSPSWRTTAIDTALLEAIHQMEEASREQDQETQQASWELVVISDLQVGASYEGLRGQDWPKHAYVVFEPISPQYIGNASLQVLQSPWHLNADGESFSPRLRLATSGDAEQDQYELSWSVSADAGTDPSTSLPIYLPPGKARIVDGPSMNSSIQSHRLLLSGDKDSFDNVAWLAPFKPRRSEIGIITQKDLNRPQEGLDLYAQGAFQSIPGHEITLQIYGPDEASRMEQAPPPTFGSYTHLFPKKSPINASSAAKKGKDCSFPSWEQKCNPRFKGFGQTPRLPCPRQPFKTTPCWRVLIFNIPSLPHSQTLVTMTSARFIFGNTIWLSGLTGKIRHTACRRSLTTDSQRGSSRPKAVGKCSS